MNPELAARLRQAVRAAGGNQAVADRSGVPLATVNNYVRGRHGMKIEALAALAAACNVSLEWLVSGGDPPSAGGSPAALPVAPPAASTAALSGAPPAASTGSPGVPASPGFATIEFAPLGLGEAPASPSPAGASGGVDVHILAKAIEIVEAIVGVAGFQDDPKALARRIATAYAVLTQPDARRD